MLSRINLDTMRGSVRLEVAQRNGVALISIHHWCTRPRFSSSLLI